MLKRLLRHPFYEKAMTYIAVVYVFLIVLELMDASCTFVNDVRPKKGDKKPLFVILSGASS